MTSLFGFSCSMSPRSNRLYVAPLCESPVCKPWLGRLRTESLRLAIVLMAMVCYELAALEGALRFNRVMPEDGLSAPEISAVAQDASGFIWFATFEGLDRYDGFSLKSYRSDPDDPRALSDHAIRFLFTDRSRGLWVGSGTSGLYRHVPDDDGFVAYRRRPDGGLADDSLRALCDGGEQDLWVGTDRGVQRWVRAEDRFTPPIPLPVEDGAPRPQIHSLLEIEPVLWIGSDRGLFRLDPGKSPERVMVPELGQRAVHSIVADPQGRLWVATRDQVALIRFTGELVRHYRHDPANPGSLAPGSLHDMHMDSGGTLWVAGRGGLSSLESGGERFQRHRHDLADPHSLSHDAVLDLFEDRTGVLWMGTLDGASSWDPGRESFVTYRRQEGREPTLAATDVWAVTQDRHGALWIGFGPFGLDRFERDTGVVEHFEHDPEDASSLQEGVISAVLEDHEGTIWVGAGGGGLSRFDPETRGFEHFTHVPGDPAGLGHRDVYRLFEDSSARLWIGTRTGLSLLDRTTPVPTFHQLPFQIPQAETAGQAPESQPAVFFSMTESEQGGLWFGTLTQGIFHWLPGEGPGTLQSLYRPGAPRSVLDLLWHSSGTLWAASGQGLFRLSSNGEVVASFGMEQGLAGTMVRGMLEDSMGHLWLAGNQGLSRFDPVAETVRNFDLHDGLQGNAFSSKAAFLGADGEMFFGGWRGLSAFFPDRITTNVEPPQVTFSDFRLSNRSVGPASRTPGSPLGVAITGEDHVVLGPEHHIFGVELAALHFSAPSKNRFQYQLLGANDEWIELSSDQRYLQFSNLSPGQYELRVKASNKDGVWTQEPKSLKLTVLPPWWRSTWAYAGYALVTGLWLWLLLSRQSQRLRLERAVAERAQAAAELERSAGRRLRAVDKMKDELLLKTSHELRTPLYGMTGLAESLMDDEPSERRQAALEMIVSSGRRLSRMVNDLLDFSKLQQLSLELHIEPLDLASVVGRAKGLLEPLAVQKGLTLTAEIPRDLPKVRADADRLQQILHNLIDNGLKFTKDGGVTVRARAVGEAVEIQVADTGVGISAEDRRRIFQIFEQADSSVERRFGGAGIGLAITGQLVELHGGRLDIESELDEGSVFSFQLPVDQAQSTWGTGRRQGEGVVDADMLDERTVFPDHERQTQGSSAHVNPKAPREPVVSKPGAAKSGVDRGLLSGRRILVVDDDPINLAVLEAYLDAEGCVVTTVDNGAEALELVERRRFDLVLVDVMMPEMSGYEVCSRLRRRHFLEDLPVIFLSALNQSSDVITGLEHGGNDYLTKPISKSELLARIRPHLRLAEVYRGLERKVAEQESEIKVLRGCLPICSSCKNIRSDDGLWTELETFIDHNSEANFTHAICPTCAEDLYPGLTSGSDE